MVGDLSPFFRSVLKLKSVRRAGWVSKVRVKDAESVADHSFSMCAMAMLLSDIQGFDTGRAMRMVILHDLAESIVGDYIPGDVSASQKLAKEKKAMASILSGLPRKSRTEYEGIWIEYLQNKTDLARFVHRIDKLEMAFQANEYTRQGYARTLLTPFFESAIAAIGGERDIVGSILKSLRPAPARK